MNKLQSYLCQYRLDYLITMMSNISKELYNKDDFREYIGLYEDRGSFRFKVHTTLLTAWGVTDIIYHAIINGNDAKGRIPDKYDKGWIFDVYAGFTNSQAKLYVNERGKTDLFYGLSQKQFWYQRKLMIIEQINRNIELLKYIPTQINSPIPIEEIILEKVGVSLDAVIKILIMLYGRCSESIDFSKIIVDDSLLKLDDCFTLENIQRVVEYFTADYNTIKNSPLEENFFYTKPFIRTDSGKIIAVNHFIVSRKCADAVYWIIRNHFEDIRSQDFTNEFGRYFEKYFGDMLNHYLIPGMYERLQEDEREKMADWAIYTTNYVVIIEQKSSLASLTTKREYPQEDSLERFFNNFVKAFKQLDSTEKKIQDRIQEREVVKIALHYEDLYIQSLIKEDILSSKNELTNTKNFFFAGIADLEKLIYVLSNNEDEYESIIKDLILAENASPGEGRELEHMLEKHGIHQNNYITHVKNHLEVIFNQWEEKQKSNV